MATERDLAAYRGALGERLAGLAVLRRQIEGTNRAIRQAAEDRLEWIQRDLDALQPRVLTDTDVADRYRDLVLERGRLFQVLEADT